MFNTYFWLDATNGTAGLIMTQILPFLRSAGAGALRASEKERVQLAVRLHRHTLHLRDDSLHDCQARTGHPGPKRAGAFGV
jgi:hypothetical protein